MSYHHEVLEHKEKRKPSPARMPFYDPDDADDWKEMRKYLDGRGLSYDVAVHNGWYPSRAAGDAYLRIVMPATNSQNIAYWQARAVYDNREPRYQSPMVPRGDSVIQVWPIGKDYQPLTVLCEGPMDALAAASHGIRAIALMGNNPTAETLCMLSSMIDSDDSVTYFADRDALKEAVLIVGSLHKIGIYATVSDPSPYKDLAKIPKGTRDTILKMYTIASSGAHSLPLKKKGKKDGH